MRFLNDNEKKSILNIKKSSLNKALSLFFIYKLKKQPCFENNIRIGILYREIRDYKKSCEMFEILIKENTQQNSQQIIKLCTEYIITLKDKGDFNKAIQIFEKFIKKTDDKILKNTIEFIKKNL
ncbi:MAG: hypothetical protein M0R46_00775 [Candidatus Muirbacterium halophilum]|nr:hypothetical protein [Candidatus Muirbacterium halophilum]MCK9474427.1 hypothetical protein [Candidatus Muirbacterium halophilum]